MQHVTAVALQSRLALLVERGQTPRLGVHRLLRCCLARGRKDGRVVPAALLAALRRCLRLLRRGHVAAALALLLVYEGLVGAFLGPRAGLEGVPHGDEGEDDAGDDEDDDPPDDSLRR